MIDRYDWAGGTEAMLRFGPVTGPVVVMALPLFEEANRTRAFAVTILRALAARGIAGALPDLPGQAESLVPTGEIVPALLMEAFAAAVERVRQEGRTAFAAAIRSGALVDALAPVDGRWHFAPQDGVQLHRELSKIARIPAALADGSPVEIAGNSLSRAFLAALPDWVPAESAPRRGVRIVRLESDPREAARKLAGAPLWRRAEPDNDPELAQLLADDMAEWIATCGA